jgi:hypothetical protein
MRDDFPPAVRELLAKRVAYHCSNPGCRHVTSGPQEDPTRVINIGVAAHITAASPDGPRFDPSLTAEQRSSAENGIWLCQSCGKLVDNDKLRYTVAVLRDWKSAAEAEATRDLERPRTDGNDHRDLFIKIERLMPDVLAEMRKDMAEYPLTREFIVLKKIWLYSSSKERDTVYFYEDHPDLENKLRVLQSCRLIQNITYNKTPRYVISETLAAYLIGA